MVCRSVWNKIYVISNKFVWNGCLVKRNNSSCEIILPRFVYLNGAGKGMSVETYERENCERRNIVLFISNNRNSTQKFSRKKQNPEYVLFFEKILTNSRFLDTSVLEPAGKIMSNTQFSRLHFGKYKCELLQRYYPTRFLNHQEPAAEESCFEWHRRKIYMLQGAT